MYKGYQKSSETYVLAFIFIPKVRVNSNSTKQNISFQTNTGQYATDSLQLHRFNSFLTIGWNQSSLSILFPANVNDYVNKATIFLVGDYSPKVQHVHNQHLKLVSKVWESPRYFTTGEWVIIAGNTVDIRLYTQVCPTYRTKRGRSICLNSTNNRNMYELLELLSQFIKH